MPRTKTASAFVLAAAFACPALAWANPLAINAGAPTSASSEQPPTPIPGSVRETVAHALGDGTALVTGDDAGLIAINAQTGKRFVMLPGVKGEVLPDPRSNGLWIHAERKGDADDGSLLFLDLEQPLGAQNPATVYRGMFWKAEIRFPEPRESTTLAKPASEADLHVDLNDGSIRDRKGKVTSDLADFLKRIGTRHRGPAVLPFPKKKLSRLRVPCEPCHGCGVATPLPGPTGWWVVTVNASGDVDHVALELYDPKSKEFISSEGYKRAKTPFGDVRDTVGESWLCRPGDTFIEFSGHEARPTNGKSIKGHSAIACLDGSWKLWDADKPGLCPEMSAE